MRPPPAPLPPPAKNAGRRRRDFLAAMGFLAPNISGFLLFTLVPLILSLALAFTNWDIKKHNDFLDEPIVFIGLENFFRLFREPNFWRYFGNTLFMMLGIPFSIVGSLVAAILLQGHLGGKGGAYLRPAITPRPGRVALAALLGLAAVILLTLGHTFTGVLLFAVDLVYFLDGYLRGRDRDPAAPAASAVDSAPLAIGRLVFVAVLGLLAVFLVELGLGMTVLWLLIAGVGGLILFGGLAAGVSVYRTAFYLPCFTAGVAIYLLWKKMYNPQTGPLNTFIARPLAVFGDAINSLSAPAALNLATAAAVVIGAVVGIWGLYNGLLIRRWRREGELGGLAAALWTIALGIALTMVQWWMWPADGLPEAVRPAAAAIDAPAEALAAAKAEALALAARNLAEEPSVTGEQAITVAARPVAPGDERALDYPSAAGWLAFAGIVLGIAAALSSWLPGGEKAPPGTPPYRCALDKGIGTAMLLAGGGVFAVALLAGLSLAVVALPAWAAAPGGLQPPNWLSNYYWAKPALMLMGFWAAIGSNNMLLYLAGLSNVPVELYEAADIDGARPWQRFWHVTWPQLAPVTFFIVVMAIIGGLQGGFESARTMTQGGPAGATTTLAYFIYTEGFETGRLGYASAVAWTLCILVFSVTIFNYRFGSRYADE